MKKILSFILFLSFSVVLGQAPDWSWAKNISLYFNVKTTMSAVDNQGNVYLVGDFNTTTATIAGITLTNTSDVGFSDAYIFKFTSDGNLIWHKQISTNKNESIGSIATDNDGNFYIIGDFGNTITLGTTTLTGDPSGKYIAKLNSSGNFVWAVKNTGVNESYFMSDIKVDNNGNVFVVGNMRGTSLTFDSVAFTMDPLDPTLNNDRVFIIKFDSNGVSQWGKMATSDEANPFGTEGRSIATDNSGGVVICGRFNHNTIHLGSITLTKTTQNNYSSNMFVAKYDGNGNEMWAYSAGSIYQNSTFGMSVATDVNNNVYVGGSFPNSIQLGSTTLNSPYGSQMFLAKYTADGTFQWAKASSSDGFSTIKSITTDALSNIYVAGMTYASSISFATSVNLNSLGTVGAFFITKYNTQGTPIWVKGVVNTDANNQISIDCKAEDDLFISGSFDKSTLQLGTTTLTKSGTNSDLFIARLYSPPLSTDDFTSNSVVLYPNPASSNIMISNIKKKCNYQIYDVLGKFLQEGVFVNEQESVDVSFLQSGLYSIRLTDNEGESFHKNFIVE